MRKLTLDDIQDLRAYERERAGFRARIIEMKRRRRVPLGELMTVTFENTETMRFQVQEMVRAERMLSDDAVQHEIDTYNELIPDDGELSGTVFIEIDDKERLQEWLPKLVGIQRSVLFRLGDGTEVRGVPQHEEMLTREAVTTTVHYLMFPVGAERAAALRAGPAWLVVDHPNYQAETLLDDAVRAELAGDLDGHAR